MSSHLKRYADEHISGKISHRVSPGRLFCMYTEYESDIKGADTYFVGEKVSSLDSLPQDLASLLLPRQEYCKFTTAKGAMPMVVIQAWQEIWKMSPKEHGGKRRYLADFKIYDERANARGVKLVFSSDMSLKNFSFYS